MSMVTGHQILGSGDDNGTRIEVMSLYCEKQHSVSSGSEISPYGYLVIVDNTVVSYTDSDDEFPGELISKLCDTHQQEYFYRSNVNIPDDIAGLGWQAAHEYAMQKKGIPSENVCEGLSKRDVLAFLRAYQLTGNGISTLERAFNELTESTDLTGTAMTLFEKGTLVLVSVMDKLEAVEEVIETLSM